MIPSVCNVIDGEYELLYVVIKLLSVEGFPSASIKTWSQTCWINVAKSVAIDIITSPFNYHIFGTNVL